MVATLSGILGSASQRRSFLLATGLLLFFIVVITILIAIFLPNTFFWNTINNLLVSIAGAGVFAVISVLYINYFFVDPEDIYKRAVVLPRDIGKILLEIAKDATNYKIFVRTGRHFRAEILPVLIKQARERRLPVQLEVILLDFRDKKSCERYASYRGTSSFDRQLWDTSYVKKEILATILTLIQASRDNPGVVDVKLFLSRRISIFRIEGSAESILVTREDPKDTGLYYSKAHPSYAAFATEFSWIRDEACSVPQEQDGLLPATLLAMFGENAEIAAMENAAQQAVSSPSPYAR